MPQLDVDMTGCRAADHAGARATHYVLPTRLTTRLHVPLVIAQ
jgi:hypothetical protein